MQKQDLGWADGNDVTKWDSRNGPISSKYQLEAMLSITMKLRYLLIPL